MPIPDYVSVAKEVHRGVSSVFPYDNYVMDPAVPALFDENPGCVEFAVLCMSALKEKGYLSRLVLCRTDTGGFLIFCLIGEVVLSSRNKWSISLSYTLDTGHTLISASGFTSNVQWREILGVANG